MCDGSWQEESMEASQVMGAKKCVNKRERSAARCASVAVTML
ncbi:hypothetical protein [Paenibacillus lemnae]|nr:hypothetical protein [Paenibacillus lemnae]